MYLTISRQCSEENRFSRKTIRHGRQFTFCGTVGSQARQDAMQPERDRSRRGTLRERRQPRRLLRRRPRTPHHLQREANAREERRWRQCIAHLFRCHCQFEHTQA